MNGSTESGPTEFWTRLRRRKVVQWGLVYVAGAWGFRQGLEYVSESFEWPTQVRQVALLALLIGLPIVLVLAWYHGDRGQQRVGRTELAILTLLFLIGGGIFWRYERSTEGYTAAAVKADAATASSSPADARPSIAVLPFENRSREADDAFFVDGIHDDILTQLSKVGALKVISRTSVDRFRGSDLSLQQIAQQLGVTSILEGGVQRGGDRVRINVQLIDASNDAHLWAESYDRELTAANIFAIQSDLAAAIAGALKAALTPAEKTRGGVVPTRNLEAWEAYQLGKQRMAKRTSGGLIEAERFFRKSIALDPGFALAYVGLADSLSFRIEYGDTPFLATLEQAQAAVDTALKLDPGLSEAWASSGLIAGDRAQTDRAEQMYRRAIELNPNNAWAVKSYGNLLVGTLRIDEGQRALQRAANLDPLSAVMQRNLAGAFESQGRFSEATAHYHRAIEIDPSMPGPYWGLGFLQAYALNRFADAVPLAKKAVELDAGYPGGPQDLAMLYLDVGDESRAFATIEQGAKRWPNDWGIQFSLALIDQLKRDDAGTVRHAQRSLVLFPRFPPNLVLLLSADLRSARYGDAIARYQKVYPELFVQGAPRLDLSNYGVAVDLALVLQKRGDTARVNVLLDAAADASGKIPRLGLSGYGITDVRVHALRGQERDALVALREAEKAGWRGPYWRSARDLDPALASIRGAPEFKAVFADIERDIAQQRARLAARPKDAPLELTEASR